METPGNVHTELGARICALRAARDLSGGELAQLVGVSHAVISDIELGRYAPRGLLLEALARVLELRPADLLGWESGE